MSHTIFLSPKHITSVIREVGSNTLIDELIEQLTHAFAEYDAQLMQIPIRAGFKYDQPRTGLLEWMPILNSGSQMLMKIVGYHPKNPELNEIPTILSNFSLYDATTGQLLAILDGTLLTALRTGAASAVASRVLASPDSSEVGIVGCGAQSITQLHALSRVFDIRTVRYFDPDESAIHSFRKRCWFLENVDFIASEVGEVVSNSDVLCVATSIDVGMGPVFKDVSTKPRLHINAVGSDFPGKTELPLSLVERAYVSPDCLEQAIKEGECQQIPANSIGKSLAELLRLSVDTKLQNSTTIFDSTGWALEDFVVTQIFLRHAKRLGIGDELQSLPMVQDPKNPYEDLMPLNTNQSNRSELIN